MKAIWKFPLIGHESCDVMMPVGAKVLTAQIQGEQACLWAEVDTKAKKTLRRFVVYGTGWELADGHQTYIGTFQTPPFVWHVFEVAL